MLVILIFIVQTRHVYCRYDDYHLHVQAICSNQGPLITIGMLVIFTLCVPIPPSLFDVPVHHFHPVFTAYVY